MKVDQKTLDEMLAELVVPDLQPGDMTITQVVEKHGISRDKAIRLLNDLVKQGRAEKFWAFDPSCKRKCMAYRAK